MVDRVGGVEYFVDVDTSGALTAEKTIVNTTNRMEKSFNKVDTQVTKTSKGVKKGMNSMRGAVGQLGFQVQDIAVQLQGGTNALTVFGQQGSQIAGIFGPGGAVVGAIIAVAAALGTAFLPALFDSSTATEELINKLKELVKTTTLTRAQADVLIAAERDSVKEKKATIKAVDEEIAAIKSRILLGQNTIKNYDAESKTAKNLAQGQEALTRELAEQVAQQQVLRSEIDKSSKNINTYNALVGEEAVTATVEQTDAVKTLISTLTTQAAVTGLTNRQTALYVAQTNNATEADLAAINVAFDKIEAIAAEEKAIRDRSKAEMAAASARKSLETQVSSVGLTDTQTIEAQFAREQQLLIDAQAQGIISKIAYEERLTELQRQYSERRKELIAQEGLALDLINWESFQNRASGALASVAIGAQSSEDAIKGLAKSILTEAIGSLIRLGIQSVATTLLASAAEQTAKTTSVATSAAAIASTTAASAAAAGATAVAWGPAATLASIATFGGAAATGVAALTAALASGTAISTAAGSTAAAAGAGLAGAVSVGSGRLNGGPVSPGNLYPITEDGKPEILRSGGNDYLLPGRNGNVISNKDLSSNGQNFGDVHINVNLPETVNNETAADSIVQNSQLIVNIVEQGLNDRGRQFG